MDVSPVRRHNFGAPADSSTISPAEVQDQLGRIEASASFRGSARLRRFLRLAVERTLAGETDQLKEYAVGRDVFDRGAEYDPRADSIVRVEAQRLRRKLREYYQTDGAMDPVVIRLPSGGYVPEFARPAQPRPALLRTEGARAAAVAPLDPRTIAVLPFTNLSPEPEQQFFCDGITEDIINALTTVPDLQVIGRTSAFAVQHGREDLREIGARLGAGTVVEGAVRKAGDMLRVTAKIIDVGSRQALWSQVFDRKMPDLFEIEDEIARSISDTLRVSFGPARSQQLGYKAPSAEAHVLYLKGRQAWNYMTREGFLSALRLFNRAISLYPDYPPPYVGLADAYTWLATWGMIRPNDALSRSKQAALEALRLDPHSGHASVSRGTTAFLLEHQWEEGLAILKKGITLQPGYSVGHQVYGACQMMLGRFQQALEPLQRAVHLDPLSIRTNRTLGTLYYVQGCDEEAQRWIQAAIALQPESAESYYLLARVHLRYGRYERALEEARKCDSGSPNALPLSILGACLARTGDRPGALQILDRLAEMSASQYVDPLAAAMVHAGLGDRSRALEFLKKSLRENSPFAIFVHVDPLFDDLRSEPRFRELLSGLKFPDS